MKYIYKFIPILILAISFAGCKDDFLELSDPNTVTNNDYWQTYDDFDAGLAATYNVLQYGAVASADNNRFDRNHTDMSRSFEFYSNDWPYTTFRWSGSHYYIGERWKGLYVGVFRANQVLENIEKITPANDFTEEQIAVVKGQALFLRALFYFWLNNSYGGAVIHTTIPLEEEEIQGSFKDADVVTETVIIPDLVAAVPLLPLEWPTQPGRITAGAALGLLGKVYLYNEDFGNAIAAFEAVMDLGMYSLTADIGENFTVAGEHNSESLFEINFSEVLSPGVHAAQHEVLPYGDQSGQSTSKAAFTASDIRGGLRMIVPTFWATELFMKDSIDTDNAEVNDTNRWSKRAYWSIAFINQDGDYYMQPTETAGAFHPGGAECAFWKKGTNWNTKEDEDSWSNTQRSGINERIIRYADIKLMYAEALLRKENSTPADYIEALQQVEDVRARAGVLPLSDYTEIAGANYIPQLHKRGPLPFTSQWVELNAQSLLAHIQWVERPLELTHEGNAIRWNDLRRWGLIRTAIEQVDAIDYTENWMIVWLDGSNSPIYPEEDEGLTWAINLYQNHQLDNYVPELHNYYPIPVDEINSNPNINE